MADNNNHNNTSRGLLGVTALVVVAVLGALGIIYVNKANGHDRVAVVTPAASTAAATAPTPDTSPSSATTASATASQVPYADCSKVTFGPPLAPLDPPSDIHVYAAPPPMTINPAKLYQATIHTAAGDIVICLQPELAPNTVNNFVTLARNHFYDGLTFHRVVAGFVIQGGDPQGTGNGGPGYKFNDEPVRQQYVIGALAMANSGVNTNGSQFYIDSADDTSSLQPLYNLFGKVQSGQDIANHIKQGDVMTSVTVAEQQ